MTVALASIEYDTRLALQQAQVVHNDTKSVRALAFVDHTEEEVAEDIASGTVEESAEDPVAEAG